MSDATDTSWGYQQPDEMSQVGTAFPELNHDGHRVALSQSAAEDSWMWDFCCLIHCVSKENTVVQYK